MLPSSRARRTVPGLPSANSSLRSLPVMLSAFAVSSLFLAFYIAHKVWRSFENTTFNAHGIAKAAYLALLASHVSLATLVPFLAFALIRFGLRGEIARHRRLARIAWPIWSPAS